MSQEGSFTALVELCKRLRGPGGCPWDREQTMETLKTYVIEEAYEVVDAISGNVPKRLSAELGDLLFQIIFVADLAAEKGWFDVFDVCRGIHAKMVQRHPHVFGEVEVHGAGEVVRNWENLKQQEGREGGALAGVPRQLPGLLKALRVTEKAAALGFDWQRVNDVGAKLEEEVAELVEELSSGEGENSERRVREELGDVLFVMANLARQLGVDPEAALQAANEKFTRRFSAMEELALLRRRRLGGLSADELDHLWEEVKRNEI